MSIKTQKIIQYIPLINIITVFVWIGFCIKNNIETKKRIKAILESFLCFIIITAIRIAIAFIFKNDILDLVTMYISIYLYLLAASWIVVRFQEKALSKENK